MKKMEGAAYTDKRLYAVFAHPNLDALSPVTQRELIAYHVIAYRIKFLVTLVCLYLSFGQVLVELSHSAPSMGLPYLFFNSQ
jgi:hypothetical protein